MGVSVRRLATTVSFAAALLGPVAASAQFVLGTAESFAVLGGSGVSNTGDTVITGDLGVSPDMAVIGFPPGLVSGEIHAADAVAVQAQNDVTTLYNFLASQPPSSDLTGIDLGGLTLVPGFYKFSSSAQLTGTLTLDAQGDAGALFGFQIGSTLTTASNATVLLINGAQDCNVAWQVGSSATIGTGTSLIGNIVALTSITMTTGANLSGRALARNGAVTLDTNAITPAACAVGPIVAPRLSKVFSPATIDTGGLSTLTITLSNADVNSASTLTADLTDTLPVGVTTVGLASTTCGGGVANATATTLSLAAGAMIPIGTATTAGTCTLSVDVTSLVGGVYVNTLPVGALQTTTGSNTTAANATLSVNSAITLSKAFDLPTIAAGDVSTLIITLGNSNGVVANLTAALIDTLPSGMVIAATPAASTDCSGIGDVIAVAGANTVSLPATRSIPDNSTCTVMVDVTAPPGASYLNTLPIGALTTDGGSNAIPTSAVLVVNAVPPPPSVSKAFVPTPIDAGDTSTLTITLFNPTTAVATLLEPFTDTLPTGVTTVGAPSTTCGVGAPVSDATSVTLPAGTTIPAGVGTAAGFCTLTINVTSTTPGLHVNVVLPGALETDVGENMAVILAILAVVDDSATPPTLSKTFSPSEILTGQSSTLTLTLCNDNAAPATLITPFVDVLPVGLVIAATPAASTTCGGTGDILATPGGTTLILPPPRTIPAFACCTTTVRVTALEPGTLVNIVPEGTLRTTNGDNPTFVESPLVVNDVVAPAPALSGWAMLMALALMSLIAFVALRRRET